MTRTARAVQVAARARLLQAALKRRVASNWLAYKYPNYLYGGWLHPDGRWIDRPHYGAIKFHEAFKALFCPECKEPVGSAPTEEDATVTCPTHGVMHWRKAFTYRTVFIASGNRWGKDFAALSEYASWILGRRPWDGSLTAPEGSGRDWGIACQTLTKSAATIICPYLEQRLGFERDGGFISEKIKNASHGVGGYLLKNGDRVHLLSQDHYRQATQETNPYEGPTWYAFMWSEPMFPGARRATIRGLTSGRSMGWGREIIGATILNSPYLFDLYNAAWNMGGDKRHIYVITGTIHENPSLTSSAIEETLSEYPREEREARATGRYLALTGRVFPEFEEGVHTFDPVFFDPLRKDYDPKAKEASECPVILAVDPHHRKPWAMSWLAILPDQTIYQIAEWPTGRYSDFRETAGIGYDEYAKIIRQIEDSFPGGGDRVLWREMDPNFSRTPFAMDVGSSTITKEMRRRGLRFRDDVNDRLPQGHESIHDLLHYDKAAPLSELNRPSLFISTKCPDTIWAFRHYTWDEHKDSDMDDRLGQKAKPKDVGKDRIDVVRYGIMRKPFYRSWMRPAGVVREFNERLSYGLPSRWGAR